MEAVGGGGGGGGDGGGGDGGGGGWWVSQRIVRHTPRIKTRLGMALQSAEGELKSPKRSAEGELKSPKRAKSELNSCATASKRCATETT